MHFAVRGKENGVSKDMNLEHAGVIPRYVTGILHASSLNSISVDFGFE